MIDKIIEHLSRDYILNVGMIEPLIHKEADILYASDTCIVVKNKRGGAVSIASDDGNVSDDMLDSIADNKLFTVMSKELVAPVSRRFGLTESMPCHSAVYAGKTAPALSGRYDIRRLDKTYAGTVHENYNNIDDIDYIYEIIERGELFGAFSDGILLGFAGLHDEGSMGLLEVLPQYRRAGVASDLAAFLIDFQQKRGRVPYVHIIKGNTPSVLMQQKIGFTVSENFLYWLF